ncbi:conserved hypothetical protein [Ricinus communis]|uniref:Uncharacterized protein n=1 Tax=Ricinus communis TaxID=3988 RepID=B9SS06_RICCO|nr:conserved hypothetical protein [Ricinus communis]
MAQLVKMKHPEQVHQEKMKESEYSSPGESESQLHKREINAAPDRYGIKPGRHYYGVDRSSVFEKKMFYMLNEKRAATGKEGSPMFYLYKFIAILTALTL